MPKMTKVILEMISNPGMYIFLDKDTKSGIPYISYRYSKANNKSLKSYDPKQESKHIIYLKMSNLYGYTISKSLPTSGFKLIDPKEINPN